jgi:hypothetical protein
MLLILAECDEVIFGQVDGYAHRGSNFDHPGSFSAPVDTYWNSELLSFISTLVRQHYSKTNSQNEDGYIDIAKKQGEPTNHTYKTTCLFTDFHKVNCKFASGSMDSTNIKQKNN